MCTEIVNVQAETSVVFHEYYTRYLTAPNTPCIEDENYNFKDCADKAVGFKNTLK